ncbi:MAG: hypothetical protein Q7S12_00910 [bacterium]|nr:hypothetical protein [bacterium]
MNKTVKIIIGLIVLYLLIGIIILAMINNETKAMMSPSSENLVLILVWPIFIGAYLECGSYFCLHGGKLLPFI